MREAKAEAEARKCEAEAKNFLWGEAKTYEAEATVYNESCNIII